MEFFGKVEHMEAHRTGISKTTGNEWKSTVVVIKDPNSLKAVAVRVFGENRIKEFKQGQLGTIHYTTYVRDYQDKDGITRYTTDISLDRWEPYAQQQEANPFQPEEQKPAPQPAPAPQPMAQPTQASQTGSDLPF